MSHTQGSHKPGAEPITVAAAAAAAAYGAPQVCLLHAST
jgi:hypothetical protein